MPTATLTLSSVASRSSTISQGLVQRPSGAKEPRASTIRASRARGRGLRVEPVKPGTGDTSRGKEGPSGEHLPHGRTDCSMIWLLSKGCGHRRGDEIASYTRRLAPPLTVKCRGVPCVKRRIRCRTSTP